MQQSEELITLVIPVYNVQKYLHQCIDSVLGQTYKNLEIILIDDGSTDMSGRICDEYLNCDSRIRVVHKKNGGLSDARNIGTQMSNGDYIAYIDSDDYVHENYILELHNAIKTRECDFSMCSYKKVKGDLDYEHNITDVKTIYLTGEDAKIGILSRRLPMYAHGKLFRRELIPYLHFPEGRLYEDVPTIWRVLQTVNVVGYIEEELYFYRKRQGSIVNATYKHERMDQLYFAEEIMRSITSSETELYYIAGSRCFFSALDNLTYVNAGFPEDEKYLIDAVKKYSKYVLKDKTSSMGLRMMALMSHISPQIVRGIGRLYKKVRN